MGALNSSMSKSQDLVVTLENAIQKVIVDKESTIRLCLTSIFAQGHLLIEDSPGTGKTSLLKTVAKLLGLKTQRIQFTNDLLPADIIGTHIFNTKTQAFEFHQGPIFSNCVIGDEINRASPKTQSACLQACLLYTSPSPRDRQKSRMPSSA